jgi:hypothetical protein
MNVHPVSSLSSRSILLDDFFERELLPRFDQARSLRNGSVARKIGTLRDSVIAALETNLDRKKRGGHNLPTDAQGLEERLRQVTGEVGEQRTTLNYAFLKLGETPEAILDKTADTALRWMRAHSKARVTSFQLSEWIHDAVRQDVERLIESTHSVSQRAIDTLQNVAQQMGRNDVPAPEELASLLRDMPRFELAALPEEINTGHSMFMGDGVVRSKIRRRLRQSVGELLKQELHRYGHALCQWNRQCASKMEFLIGSYADAYRVQLHRISGISKDAIDAPQLEDDLARLKNWGVDKISNEMRTQG